MEITIKEIERLLDNKLNEKFEAHLKPIKAGMAHLATSDELKSIAKEINDVKKTLNSHTSTLDAISVNTQSWTLEKAALVGRMDRHADAIRQLADKLGLKLENFDVSQ